MLQKSVGNRLLEAADYLWQPKTWECDAEYAELDAKYTELFYP